MIDPIAGFRVNPSRPEVAEGHIRRQRYNAVVVAIAFAIVAIGLPVAAIAAVLAW
jgi:hypothetical protein